MQSTVLRLGNRYEVTIVDAETGEVVGGREAYFYGTSTDATDFWETFSCLPPGRRADIREGARVEGTLTNG